MGHTTARCRLVLADLASSEVYCFVPSRLRSFKPFSLLSKKDVNFQNTKFYFFQGEIIIINRVIIIYCIAKQTLLQCISSVILTLFFFFQVKTTAESIEEPGNPIYFQFY